ncbi:MAG: ATP-binding cassette domain-containing protein [Lentisphaerae bacterium]|nr:ATP-binding cassette domain-containing protein [Lentisphaerota bacterium]
MITVENLTKRFGKTTAVDDISFHVGQGEIVGFLGPNGAGKTTTMRILSCFMPPTAGKLTVDGLDILSHSVAVRRRIGYLPENSPVYPEMRVVEYLRYRGSLKGLQRSRLRHYVDDSITRCALGEVRNSVIGRLSRGFVQRIGLADSLLHRPQILILDEPTLGLDPNQIRHIRYLIKGLAPRHTVLLSSHILSEVENVCDRVLIISQGRIVASDSPRNLVGLLSGNPRVTAEMRGPGDEIRRGLSAIDGVVRVEIKADGAWHQVTCECEPGKDVREQLFLAAKLSGWGLRELGEVKGRLEDVFAEITSVDGNENRGLDR